MRSFISAWTLRALCLLADVFVLAAAYLSAFAFRLNFNEPLWGWGATLRSLAPVCAVELLALSIWGCYRVLWRYTSVGDVPRFVGAAFSAFAVFIGIRFFCPSISWLRIPYSISFLNLFFSLGGLLALRVLARCVAEREFSGRIFQGGTIRRTLIIGAGDVGNRVAKEMRLQSPRERMPVGFLDDDPAKRHASLAGVRVLGALDDLPRIVRKNSIDEVVVSYSKPPRATMQKLLRLCEECSVPMRIVPDGMEPVSRLRKVDVADLLGREETPAGGAEVVAMLNRKTVMVTGAGGSIGGELARQVLRAGPALLVLVERNEHALYEIDRELRAINSSVPFVPLLADVGDKERMEEIVREHKPDFIFHAAAYKHVPLVESNASEALKNNVLATRMLGEIAVENAVERFVLISTDKAVNPVSAMGATKRLCEIALQDLNRRGKTQFCAVRFGNVLGSSGSVVPLFEEQIRRGGPVTVTHPEMKRYFMTIREAVALVLEAGSFAKGGEIFVLDMGEPMKIVELAKSMIALHGLRPQVDVKIVFTGIRPGEKLFEELDVDGNSAFKTGHARILVSRIEEVPAEKTADILERCHTLAQGSPGAAEICGLLR